MAIKVYNTLSGTKEPFEPVHPPQVGMYLCGPTVYKHSHIGHAVGPVIFDAIKRYLTYKGYKVTFVVNVTDVDDKLIVEANRLGMNMKELAEQVTGNYLACLAELGVYSIDHMPRATECMDAIIALIQRLIGRDAAYELDGDVYFDITRDDDYGKLTRQSADRQESGTRDLAGAAKRNPGDFALWKSAKPGEPSWDSPWGQGRPGWHIECSAMSMSILGETFDIHGGGMDLQFPHHENEIAQSETATGACYARYWMHNGLTRMNTKKMSKSEGNIRTLSDLLQQYSGELLRYFLLSTHYRRPIDFSDESLTATEKGLQTFYRLFDRIERVTGENAYQPGPDTGQLDADTQLTQLDRDVIARSEQFRQRFIEAMDDDFNTASAIAVLHEFAGMINKYVDDAGLEQPGESPSAVVALAATRTLLAVARLLGLFEKQVAARGGDVGASAGSEETLIDMLLELRSRARKDKQFALADFVRDGLAAQGITIEDRPGETVWHR